MRAQPPAEGHRTRFSLDFRTRTNSLARLRRSFDAWLTEAGVDDDVAYDLVLALNEAVSNSVEHAYPPDVDGTVLVNAELGSDGAVCVVVSDDGRWRVPPAALSGRGRGLLLMR